MNKIKHAVVIIMFFVVYGICTDQFSVMTFETDSSRGWTPMRHLWDTPYRSKMAKGRILVLEKK